MRKEETRKRRWVLVALLALLPVFFPAGPGSVALAATVADSDSDGFPDSVESGTNTFTFYGGGIKWSNCSLVPAIPREGCVDPKKKDIFVAFPNASAFMPPKGTRLAIFNKITSGDNTWAHDIPATYVNTSSKQVLSGLTSTQKAVFVSDNTVNDQSDILGITKVGTPNTTGGCTIYTQRIVWFLDTTCAGKRCVDNTTQAEYGSADNTFRNLFVGQVVAHELGHAVNLVTPADNVIGPHYPAENKVVMSQYVYKEYPNGTGGTDVKFYIPQAWTSNDRNLMKLKP
jgi:hypothetical protein